jgi:hypothetical protein
LNRKKSNYWVQNVVDINEYILDAKLGKRITQK